MAGHWSSGRPGWLAVNWSVWGCDRKWLIGTGVERLSELLQRLSRTTSLIALQLQGREGSRLIPRDTGVPGGYIALVQLPDGRMAVVPAGADPGKESPENISLFRAGPITLSLKVQPIRTSDGHEVACSVTLRVAVRPNVNDLNGLLKEFVKKGKPEIDAADIMKYLEEHVLVAARVFGRGKSAAEILSAGGASDLADHLAAMLERPLLAVGLTLVPGMMVNCIPISEGAISFFQPSGGAAGQEVLHKALLSQFDDLAQRANNCGEMKVAGALLTLRAKVAGQTAFTTFEQVMQVLPERLRTEVYDALLKLFAADPGERLVAVAASLVMCWNLTGFEAGNPGQTGMGDPAWKATLPADLGGCRSVRMAKDPQGQPIVLAGCQKGVAVLEAQTGRMVTMLQEPYRGSSAQGQGSGYNAAVLRRRQCWASKSDVGLLCWELDHPGSPFAVMGAGRGHAVRFARAVTVDANAIIWFGADNWLVNCAGGLPTAPDLKWFVPVDSPVTSVEVDGEDIWLGTQAGGLWRISELDPRSCDLTTISPGQAVEALTVRRTGLLRWLVYADGKSVVIRNVSGTYMRTLAGSGGIRAARTAGAWMAGLNDWRDAMSLWNCSSLNREPIKIAIQKLANARIQDFDVG